MNRLSYTEQDALLRKICASGEDLASVLKNKGLDYWFGTLTIEQTTSGLAY